MSLVSPIGDQPPARQVEAALPRFGIVAHHRQRISRRPIPGRGEVRQRPFQRDREGDPDFADIGGKDGRDRT
jgi:hypothetical protein